MIKFYKLFFLLFLTFSFLSLSEEIKGKILKVTGEKVIIDLGEEQGIKEGQILDIIEPNDCASETIIAQVKIIKVYRFVSEGVIISESYPSNIKELMSEPVSKEIKEYYYDKDEKVNIKRRITKLEQKKAELNLLGWSLMALSAALVGGGLYSTKIADNYYADYNKILKDANKEWYSLNGDMSNERKQYWLDKLNDKRDKVIKWDNLSTVSYISAGVVGSWGIYSIYKAKKMNFPKVAFNKDSNFTGIILSWSF